MDRGFPVQSLARYVITAAGRLIDAKLRDLEVDGYVTGGLAGLKEYRARFSAGQLESIVRLPEVEVNDVYYGLASFRWFHP